MTNTVYLIGIVFCLILVHSAYKRYSANEKQMHYESNNKVVINDENINNENSEVDTVDIRYSIELPVETPVEKQKELGKNTWLYPTDDFGKMEKGREL